MKTPVMSGALPLVGHALAFLRDKPRFLLACREQCGDVVRLMIGGPTVLLNGPDDIRHVLVDAAPRYRKSAKIVSDRGRELSGAGLHTASGAQHLALRRMVQPLFHREMVAGHEAAVHIEADRWLARHGDDVRIDLWREMLAFTQRVMLHALLGRNAADEHTALAQAIAVRRRYVEYFFTSNLPRAEYWPLPIVGQYRAARTEIRRALTHEIAQRRRTPAAADWLSMLVHAEGRDGSRLTDDQVFDEALTLTSTGYETVAAMLTWTLHLLSHHPSVQQSLATASASQDEELSAVLDESLRLYPPTWLYVRTAVEHDELPSGHTVQVGDKIYLSPFTMHRHPAWYEAPELFRPHRFMAPDVRGRPRYAFYPFGGGARQCIGEPFARMEAAVFLRRLLERYAIVPVRPLHIPLRPSIVLEPRGGLPIRLVRR